MDNKDLKRNNDILPKMSRYKTSGNPFPIQPRRKSDVRSGAQNTEPAQHSVASEPLQAGPPDALSSTNINLDDLSRQIMIAGMNALGMTNPSVQKQSILGETNTATMNPLVNRNNIPMSSVCADNLINSVPDGSGLMRYRAPDMDSFTFDRNTGYRFDPTTGLHYDANSGFFINVRLKVFMRWDPLSNTYLREAKRPRAGPSMIPAAFQPLGTSPVTPAIHSQPSAPTAIFPDFIGKLTEQSSLHESNERSLVDEWSSRNTETKSRSDDFSRSQPNSLANKGMGSNERRNGRSGSRSRSQSNFQHRTRESEEQNSASGKRKRSRSPNRDSRKSDRRARMTPNQRTRRSRSTGRTRSSSHSPVRKRPRSLSRGRKRRSTRSPARKRSRSLSRGRKRRSTRSPVRKRSRSLSRGRKRCSTRSPARKRSRSRSRGRTRRSTRSPARKRSRSRNRESRCSGDEGAGMIPNQRSRRSRSAGRKRSSSHSPVRKRSRSLSRGRKRRSNRSPARKRSRSHSRGRKRRSNRSPARKRSRSRNRECRSIGDEEAGMIPNQRSRRSKSSSFSFSPEPRSEGGEMEADVWLSSHPSFERQNLEEDPKSGLQKGNHQFLSYFSNKNYEPDKREKVVGSQSDKVLGSLNSFKSVRKSGGDGNLSCYKCGFDGHLVADCGVEDRLCYCCFQVADHIATDCPERSFVEHKDGKEYYRKDEVNRQRNSISRIKGSDKTEEKEGKTEDQNTQNKQQHYNKLHYLHERQATKFLKVWEN